MSAFDVVMGEAVPDKGRVLTAMTAFWLNVIWMMAQQLWWEKSQGNLELYFAAPMNIMSVLFGMAIGGFVMSSTRAAAVLVIATLLFGVTFDVEQWGLLLAVASGVLMGATPNPAARLRPLTP